MKLTIVIISVAIALVIGLVVGVTIGVSWDQVSINNGNINSVPNNTNTVAGNTNSVINGNTNTFPVDYCESDDDCFTDGCNGEICHSQINSSGGVSICVYHERFSCLTLSSCGCVNNKCQWDQNDEYLSCLEQYK